MPPTVRWYYDRVRDAIVVMTTTMTYTLLHVGRINNLAKVPLIPALADLLEFLRPLIDQPGHEFFPKLEHLPNYIHLPELQPGSPDFL